MVRAFELSLLRIVFLPIIALLATMLFNLSSVEGLVLVLMHGMPVALSMIVLSERYDFYKETIASLIFVSFIGMTVILGLGIALFDVKVIPDPMSLVLVATTSMLFSGMGMILSRFVKDPETAGAAANAITFPMMFLSGTFFQLEQMPEFLRSITTVLPLTYVNNGLRDAMIMGEPQRAIMNTIIVVVLGVICLLVGAWITKWEGD